MLRICGLVEAARCISSHATRDLPAPVGKYTKTDGARDSPAPDAAASAIATQRQVSFHIDSTIQLW
jgi:hypothetical protein